IPAPHQGSAAPTESDTPVEHLKAHVVSQSRRSSWHAARKDCSLNLPRTSAPAHHSCEETRHLVQSSPASYILRAFEPAIGHQAKRRPARCRSMVKTRLQGNVAVVQTVRVQLHLRSAGRPTEEVDGSPLPHHVDRPLPRCRTCHRVDHNVGAAALGCQRASRVHYVLHSLHLQHFSSAKQRCCGDLILPLHNRNNLDTGQFSHMHEHQSNGTCTDYHHRI